MSDVPFEGGTDLPVFIARGAVADLIDDDESTELLLSGAAGTGKSFGVMAWLHGFLLENPGARALVCRKTHVSLTSSTLVTLREKVLRRDIDNGHLHWFGGSAAEPPGFRYNCGSFIAVGGLDRSSRVLSTEFDVIVVDEATEVTAEDLDVLVTRLRNNKAPRQQLVCMTNPGPPSHHLKMRCDAKRMRMLYSRHEDNPALYNLATGEWTEYGRSYINRLDSLTGVRYERLRWGKWVSAEGLIYSDFNDAVHVRPGSFSPTSGRVVVSIDFGFTNPTSCTWTWIDDDGRSLVYREIYKTGLLVEDLARMIRQIQEEYPWEPWPEAWICDHDAEGRATLERHLKISTTPAIKKVKQGIEAVQARLRIAGDGRPRFQVMEHTLCHEEDETLREAGKPIGLREEIYGYVWAKGRDGTPAKEEPVKLNDHAMDGGLRYSTAYLDIREDGRLGAPLTRSGAAPGGSVHASRYGRPVAKQTRIKAPKRYGG